MEVLEYRVKSVEDELAKLTTEIKKISEVIYAEHALKEHEKTEVKETLASDTLLQLRRQNIIMLLSLAASVFSGASFVHNFLKLFN